MGIGVWVMEFGVGIRDWEYTGLDLIGWDDDVEYLYDLVVV